MYFSKLHIFDEIKLKKKQKVDIFFKNHYKHTYIGVLLWLARIHKKIVVVPILWTKKRQFVDFQWNLPIFWPKSTNLVIVFSQKSPIWFIFENPKPDWVPGFLKIKPGYPFF